MSLKKVLGLESFPLKDSEIMRRIVQAKRSNLREIEFSSGKKKVRIKLSQVSPDGMMRGRQGYYEALW